MKKGAIGKKTYDKIMIALKKAGVTPEIFELAQKMEMSLPHLFYEKVIEDKSPLALEQLSKHLLGLYGNYFSSYYYKNLGYEVENEYPVYDENGKLLTRADLYFIDNEGKENYCEVKAAEQIISRTENYKDSDEESLSSSYHSTLDEIKKYKSIGSKLLKQVDKLSKSGKKVNVIIFSGCNLDDEIKSKLKEKNVIIRPLMMDIKQLEKFTMKLVFDVRSNLQMTSNITQTTRRK